MFPYVKKRIEVVSRREQELSPIDCAIDEMKSKVSELNEVVYQTKPDVKKLQLKLSGSISPQVSFVFIDSLYFFQDRNVYYILTFVEFLF